MDDNLVNFYFVTPVNASHSGEQAVSLMGQWHYSMMHPYIASRSWQQHLWAWNLSWSRSGGDAESYSGRPER